jgi:hypothetical protein
MSFEIYGAWIDVMRLAMSDEDLGKQDIEFWLDHQKEIEFAFKVLAGLNLATWHEPNENGVQDIAPSNALKRLLRYSTSHYTCRRVRDKHLRAALANAIKRRASK